MQKIVVGYDGTDTATRAAQEAKVLAQATGAELHIVTVVDDADVRQGMVTAEVQQRAEQNAAARVRSQGISRVLGSVAIAVLRGAPCSVYVAHIA